MFGRSRLGRRSHEPLESSRVKRHVIECFGHAEFPLLAWPFRKVRPSRSLGTLQPSQRVKVCVGDLLVGVLVQLRVGQIAVELFRTHVHSLAQAWVLHLHEVV